MTPTPPEPRSLLEPGWGEAQDRADRRAAVICAGGFVVVCVAIAALLASLAGLW